LIDNLLVRIHFIIVMIRWTGLAPWEFEFPFPGSLTSTFLPDLFSPRFRSKREHLDRIQGLSPESQGQNLVLTVLFVPRSIVSGRRMFALMLIIAIIASRNVVVYVGRRIPIEETTIFLDSIMSSSGNMLYMWRPDGFLPWQVSPIETMGPWHLRKGSREVLEP